MSFNFQPDWTQNFTIPNKASFACPSCGSLPFNYDEVIERLFEDTAYELRHIPPTLTFNCDNEDCELCDKDIVFNLGVVIYILERK